LYLQTYYYSTYLFIFDQNDINDLSMLVKKFVRLETFNTAEYWSINPSSTGNCMLYLYASRLSLLFVGTYIIRILYYRYKFLLVTYIINVGRYLHKSLSVQFSFSNWFMHLYFMHTHTYIHQRFGVQNHDNLLSVCSHSKSGNCHEHNWQRLI